MKKLIPLILLAIAPQLAFSQSAAITTPGQIDCPQDANGDDIGYCYYTLQNIPKAQTLAKKIEQTVLQGVPMLPGEGVLEPLGENEKVLVFYSSDGDVLAKMKSVIPLLDTNESFATTTMVELKTEIYEINETGLTNLGAEISNLKVGYDIGDLANGGGGASSDGGFGVDLKLGIVTLSGLISAERSKGNMIRRGTIVKAVPNLSDISYSDKMSVYAAPGVGSTFVSQNAGLTLGGRVSVNAADPSLVNIKDFSLEYGTLVGEDRVNIVSIPYENLILKEGAAFPLVSSASMGTMETTTAKFFGLGKKTVTENSKLMVFTSVKVYTWDEYIESIRDLIIVGKQNFDQEEVDAMPEACPYLEDIFNDAELIAKRDSVGDPMLSVALKKDYACPSNIKTRVKVKIRGEGIDKDANEHITTIERLMHIPLRIEGIKRSKFQEPELKFTIRLESLGAEEAEAKLKTIFAPNVLQIDDLFWIDG